MFNVALIDIDLKSLNTKRLKKYVITIQFQPLVVRS